MLRILLLLLALISIALAVILEMPWVLGIAAALIIALLVVWIAASRKRKRPKNKQETAAEPSPDRELAALGISDIRPKGSGSSQPAEESPSRPPTSGSKKTDSPKETSSVPSTSTTSEVRTATVQRLSTRRRSQDNFNTIADDRFAQITGPYLQAIRAATGAQTVCLLKQEDVEPHYSIETIVSSNSYARSSGEFHAKQPFVSSATDQRIIVKGIGGENGYHPSVLGYYREQIAVKQVAVVPVPPSASPASYYLVADTMTDGELSEPYRQGLLTQFSDVLRSILDMIELEENLSTGETMRPRREIIQEEMEQARSSDKTLMFALAHLKDEENITAGGRMAIAAAERALENALRTSAGDRVERFGELTYGVFRHESDANVEDWADELQKRVESGRGALKAGAAVGIVVMGDRHDSPESLREDATHALREAYETGHCTIIE
jgi:hypothetical protein